jgi:hypothetical protein
MTSAYPRPLDALVASVREMATQDRAWPSQRKIMRECRVGADRAAAALAALRASGFDPAVPATSPQRPQERPAHDPDTDADGVSGAPVEAVSAPAQIDEEALVSDAAGTATRTRRDWTSDLGVLVVALAAAILTFTTLRDLAVAVGITGELLGLKLAWLLPITTGSADAGPAAMAWAHRLPARAVLRADAGPAAVAWAHRLPARAVLRRRRGRRAVGGLRGGLLPLGGGGEHLLGEDALLGDQMLGEVKHRVEDLLRVAPGGRRRMGSTRHPLHQFAALLSPLLPQSLEALLGTAGQLGELLLRTRHRTPPPRNR